MSAPVVYRTAPGVPSGVFTVRVNSVGQQTVTLSWSPPTRPNGPIVNYDVTLTTQSVSSPTLIRAGLVLQTTLSNLLPYTPYNLSVSPCTAGGCMVATSVSAVTLQAPPANQRPPAVVPDGPYRLTVNWSPPLAPNGKLSYICMCLLSRLFHFI